jgi:peptidoglycan hydrolase-like protein with peptidoglycan-binding domain
MSKKLRRLCPALVALCLLLGGPANALAGSQGPPPASVAGGSLRLVVQHVHGRPPFQLVGERVVIRGIVTPFVAGQRVLVAFYRDGRKVAAKRVSVLDLGNGAGQFHIGYSSARPGVLSARASHAGTSQQAAFGARSKEIRVVATSLGQGASGPAVRLLQSELNGLHYSVPISGVFDEATGRAVIAYRKMTGLARVPYTSRQVFQLLDRGAGKFHVRYPGDGKHVEADLTRQVLAEIEPGGKVRRIYTVSSGKPSTPTVLGRFQVYEKTPGTNSEGMVDSNYFIRGYAIHGYAEVPTYAASHGCLRVPIPDAASIYAWVQVGTPVDVYYEGANASNEHVRPSADAGP